MASEYKNPAMAAICFFLCLAIILLVTLATHEIAAIVFSVILVSVIYIVFLFIGISFLFGPIAIGIAFMVL